MLCVKDITSVIDKTKPLIIQQAQAKEIIKSRIIEAKDFDITVIEVCQKLYELDSQYQRIYGHRLYLYDTVIRDIFSQYKKYAEDILSEIADSDSPISKLFNMKG